MSAESAPRRLCLITGASAGIGAAFARIYASHGYDLALVARREDRLKALAEQIKLRSAVEALVIPADLSDPAAGEAVFAAIAGQGRKVSALVNNAGYGVPGRFGVPDWAAHAHMLQLMLTSVCELTHRALPGMLEDGFGRVVNVASLAGLMPGSPGTTLYAPVKAFLVRFSESLHVETLNTGVHVTALCPGFTYTEFHDVNQTRRRLERIFPPFMWLGADEVAAAGYEAVEANRPICVTGAPNRAIAAVAKLVPDEWALALMSRWMAPGARRGR